MKYEARIYSDRDIWLPTAGTDEEIKKAIGPAAWRILKAKGIVRRSPYPDIRLRK